MAAVDYCVEDLMYLYFPQLLAPLVFVIQLSSVLHPFY